jgi:hypothetical protein
MMQRWGHAHVSSALEVYRVLSCRPLDADERALWHGLLSIEPPVWGSPDPRRLARLLAGRGYRLWSWDDHGVALSDAGNLPPATLRYLAWSDVVHADSRTPVRCRRRVLNRRLPKTPNRLLSEFLAFGLGPGFLPFLSLFRASFS